MGTMLPKNPKNQRWNCTTSCIFDRCKTVCKWFL